MRKFKRIKACRCCGGDNLVQYLDLGRQPLANSYHRKERLKRFPLQVMLCRDCFHSQLSVVVDPDIMFRNYLYVSGTTSTLRKHFDAFAKNAMKRFDGDVSVLDVACNDGTLLELFKANGAASVVGVDPAQNLRKITKKKDIDVVVDYWNHFSSHKASQLTPSGNFDIITAANVFAHVDDLGEFLFACRHSLSNRGLVFLEFPYAVDMVGRNEFDTVYHEHLSYFLVNSFSKLADRSGFTIVDIIRSKIHGGSIRFVLQYGEHKKTFKLNKMIKQEEELGLLSEQAYFDFAARVEDNKNMMKDTVQYLKDEYIKVIGYGASAKGNTMLNYFELDLDYIVDDNNLKWTYYTPGRDIRIASPFEVTMEPSSTHIVILSWNFKDEIVQKVMNLRKGRKINFITYVPDIKVWTEG